MAKSDNEIPKAPAVGIRFQVQLDDGQIMEISTHYDQGTPPAAANDLIDGLANAVARQKARAQVDKLTREIDELEYRWYHVTVAAYERLRAQGQEKLAAFDQQILDVNAETEKVFVSDREAHERSGRRGDYVLSGTAKGKAADAARRIKQLTDERETHMKAEMTAASDHEIVAQQTLDLINRRLGERETARRIAFEPMPANEAAE